MLISFTHVHTHTQAESEREFTTDLLVFFNGKDVNTSLGITAGTEQKIVLSPDQIFHASCIFTER